jgi:hypothetical protein
MVVVYDFFPRSHTIFFVKGFLLGWTLTNGLSCPKCRAWTFFLYLLHLVLSTIIIFVILYDIDVNLLITWSNNTQRRRYFLKKVENQVWEVWHNENLSQAQTLLELNRMLPQSQLYLNKSYLIFFPTKMLCCITQNTSLSDKYMVTCFSAYKTLI